MALPCFPWHAFAFGLWADTSLFLSLSLTPHIHTHTHSSKRETLAARGVWRRTYTHTKAHTAGNIDFLFGITKQWVTQLRGWGYSLDHSANKQTCYVFWPTLISYAHPSEHCIEKNSWAEKSARNSSSWSKRLHHFSSTSRIRRSLLLPRLIVSLCESLSSSVCCFLPRFPFSLKEMGFFLASHGSGVDCLASSAPCRTVQQVNMFYQPHGSHKTLPIFQGNLDSAFFLWPRRTDESMCTRRTHFVWASKNNTNIPLCTLLENSECVPM